MVSTHTSCVPRTHYTLIGRVLVVVGSGGKLHPPNPPVPLFLGKRKKMIISLSLSLLFIFYVI